LLDPVKNWGRHEFLFDLVKRNEEDMGCSVFNDEWIRVLNLKSLMIAFSPLECKEVL
jgi:hypothetical protein